MSDRNPFHQQGDQSHYQQSNQSYAQQPGQGQYSNQPQQYQPPPGPPPQQQFQDQNPWATEVGQQQSFQAPGRTTTFKEEDFVPSEERGEQREAIQQYELSKAGTKEDRDLETLAQEFPSMDGSLVAALYGDTKDLDQARRMLQELNTT